MVSLCLPSDALLQYLASYLGFSYLGRGVSLHGCSSKAQPLLLTLDEGYLLTAAPPDQNLSGSILGHTLQDSLELTPKKDDLFIIGDWDAKVESQETPGVTGKFGLGVWNEAGQWLKEFCQENALVIASTLFQQHKRRLYTWTS